MNLRYKVVLIGFALPLAAVALAGGVPAGDDPLPLLRIALTPERLAPQLARLKQGVLVKLPREDFEARVLKAARAGAAKNVARIVRADYRAELTGQDLTGGRGVWGVLNSGPGPAVLPLAPLSLALSRCAWEGGGEAIVGDLDGKGLGAWVDGMGPASLVFDWSCRGTPTPQGTTFDLRLPPSPQTTLALELPADAWPALPARAGLLTGPHDAGTAGKKLWRIQLAGKAQVELTIRRLPPGQPPTVFVQTQSRQLVTPDRVAADYEFQVEIPRGAVRELTFDGDGTLEPFEVTARSADLQWRWDAVGRPAKGKPGNPGTLVVEFRTPQQGLIQGLRVRCLAPRAAAPAEWVSPALRLRQAVARSETLRLQFHPDVHVGRWQGGDFHLADSATEADGSLALNLADTRAAAGTASARPRCQLQTGGAEFTTFQETRWHVEPGATALHCAIRYDVARGQLHQLAVKLPSVGGPFHVASVAVEPKGLLRHWTLAGAVLLVDLDHAVTPRAGARLVLQLRSALRPLHGPKTLAVPDVVPLDASLRQGTLAVSLDPLFHAQLLQSSVPPLEAPPAAHGNAPDDAAAFVFAYRDPPLTATLRLFPQRPEIKVHSRQEIMLGPGAGHWQARVEVEPLLGRPSALDVYLSAPLSGPWQVEAEGQPALVHHWERLPVHENLPVLLLLGAGSPTGRAALQGVLPRGQLWRVHFAQPLALKATLRFAGAFRPSALPILSKRLPLALPGPSAWNALAEIARLSGAPAPSDTTWDSPVLSVPGVAEQQGELVVRPGGQRIEGITGSGFAGLARSSPGAGLGPADGLTFRLDRGMACFPSLALHTKPGQGRSEANAVCEASELTTGLDTDGRLIHLLRVRLRNWHEPRFTVSVPGAVTALAAKVDGGWLERVDAESIGQATHLSVAVHAGAAVQHVELLYASAAEGGTGPLVRTLAAPAPQLPLTPLTQARFWRLPAGWVPADRGRIRPRGQPEGIRDRQTLAAVPGKIWHAGESLPVPWQDKRPGWLNEQRSELLAAAAKVRTPLDQGLTLGEALQGLAAAIGESLPVVIDSEGLRAAGIERTTIVPAAGGPGGTPFWEAIGLVYVPCPSAPLLTTPARLQRWHGQVDDAAVIGAVIDMGVAEAAIYGQDHAGCFAAAAHWLRAAPPRGTRAGPTAEATRLFAQLAEPLDAAWTEWEPLPGLLPDATLAMFHAPTWRLLGYLAAGLWMPGAAWVLRRVPGTAFFRMHLFATGLLAAAVLWLPALLRDRVAVPLLLAEVLAFAVAFTVRAWPRRAAAAPRQSTMVRPAGAALMLLLAVLPLAAQVTSPSAEAAPVYLVGGSEPGQEFALVTPELLKKLDTMASRAGDMPAGTAVVAARYQGKMQDGRAQFEARFDLHHFADKSTFVLPLTGVQLQPGVFLDGVPIFPVAHKNGYALTLRGKGAKRLTLTFQLRPAAVSDFQELRFGVPKAGQADLELSQPAPAKAMYLATGLGEQKLQRTPQGGATLHGQLGYEGLVQVRWSAPGASSPRDVAVREAYAWDLRPATLGLTAAVQLDVSQGSLAQAYFLLPEGLEVRTVELARPTGPPTVLAAATIRQWEVTGKGSSRQLVVDFAQPIAGSFTLRFEIVPRLALVPGQWLLQLPAPRFGTTTEGLLAYRIDGYSAVPSPQNLSVGTPSVELLAWAKGALRDAPAATRAHSFRRKAPAAALSLAVQPVRPAARLDMLCTVGPRYTSVAAQVMLTGGESLGLVEIELPPRFELATVAGDPVHHWSRHDRILQVWLRQAHPQARVDVHGWIDRAQPGPATRFDLTAVRVLRVRLTTTAVELEPDAGVSLRQDRAQNLTPVPGAGALRYTSDAPSFNGAFTVRPAGPTPATGQAFTLVEHRGNGVEVTTALHVQTRPGPVEIQVNDWTGADLRLESPAPVERKAYRHQGREHRWTLVFPPGLPRTVTLILRGRLLAHHKAEPWTLPVVNVAPIPHLDQWIGLDGVELADPAGLALQPVASHPKGPAAYPAPPRMLGTGVRVGRLMASQHAVVRMPASAMAAPAEILLAQQDTSWGGAGWVHQLRLLVFSHRPGVVSAQLPPDAVGRAVAVGDHVFVPESGALEIPLPDKPGPRVVQISWTYPHDEVPDRPRLDRPSVAGLTADDMLTRFWLPAAYRLARPPADVAAQAAEVPLREAAARMRLCALWAARGASAEDLRREQQIFRSRLDQARLTLARLDRIGLASNTAELSRHAAQLDQENTRLAKDGGYGVGQPDTSPGQSASVLPLAKSGLPICCSEGDMFPPGPLALRSNRADERALARSATELMLLAVVAFLLLSCLSRGLPLLRTLWPETIMAVTGFGIAVGGLSPLAIALLGGALVLRGVWLVPILRGGIAVPKDRHAGEAGPLRLPTATSVSR